MIVNLTVRQPHAEPRAFEFRRDRVSVGAGSKNDLVVASDRQIVRLFTLDVSASGVRLTPETDEVRVRVRLPDEAAARRPEPELLLPVGSEIDVDGGALIVSIDRLRRADSVEIRALDAVVGLPGAWESSASADGLRRALALCQELAGAEDAQEFAVRLRAALGDLSGADVTGARLLLPSGDGGEWTRWSAAGDGDVPLALDALDLTRGELRTSLEAGRMVGCVQGARRALLVPMVSGGRVRAVLALAAEQPAALSHSLADALGVVAPIAVAFAARSRRLAEAEAIEEENRYFKEKQRRHYLFKDLVTESASMRRLHRELGGLVSSDAPVLLSGEAGTGKELLARALHHLGGRASGLLISQHCGVPDEDALDFELFGYSRRGSAGGGASRRGVFELANEGTVFLDEVHALSPRLQTKLHRMLTEGEVFRIGESLARSVDVRVVCSTHLDLMALADEGRFRRDLAIALTRHVLHVPPLRDRREDIAPLAGFFVKRWARRYRKQVESVEPETLAWLQKLRWPGNVRELLTVLERAVLQAEPDQLTLRRADFDLR